MNEGIEGTERFLSPGSGRGLRAVRHFSAGELVFACPAYSYVLTVNEREAHCENCFSRREDLFKCGKCKQAHYCNVECQRSDWTMHKLECVAMCAYGENWCPSETVRLVARIILKQRVTPERDPSERLLLLSEFEAHLDKMDSEKDEMNNADIAALHHFYSKHISDIPGDQALTELFAQVNCNGFTIEDEELSHLGSAVFPDVALMNHSCSPNVIVTYKGTVAEVRAIREIDPGDEVFNSYIDLLYPTEDRKERLLDSYFFSCQCTECTSKSKDKAKMETRKLSSPPEPEKIKSMVHYAKIVIEEFRRAKHYKNILFLASFSSSKHCLCHYSLTLAPPSELLEICELSLEKMGAIFADTNVYMLHMMYQAMGVCLYMQDWDGALRYGEKIVQPYSVHYPAYSLNVASMYLKLGRLYLGLEKKKQGIRALKRAVAIMEMAHGKDHNYVAEVKREIEEQK
ncbi:N-lysine methyltransferase SMYD2-A [Dissostichus eleginoides]|nr:N-lysine methyltransferase SMYD2-A [Dissostichus eleginoides]